LCPVIFTFLSIGSFSAKVFAPRLIDTMLFRVIKYSKIKSSFVLDTEILVDAKAQATRAHLTIDNIVEEALTEYCKTHYKIWE
jgi:hypothetical protein